MPRAPLPERDLSAAPDRLLPGAQPRRKFWGNLKPAERDGFALLLFLGAVILLDRLTGVFPATRSWNSLVYLFAILGIGWWTGFRAALGACGILLAYVWIIYHYHGVSAVARDPKMATTAVLVTLFLFPPFALIGGAVNLISRRAAARVIQAEEEVERESEQRRTVEAELWVSEEMRRMIVDSSVDALIGIAPDRTISMWGPNAEKLFGWTRGEAIGCPAETRIVAPAPFGDHQTDLLALLDSNQYPVVRQQIETTALTKVGAQTAVEMYIADHNTAGGTVYIVFARDISERKRSERMIRELNANLSELNANLEERVAERTRQLEIANEELLGFTYSVSHDLRAPLRSIVSQSRIVRDEAQDLLDEEMTERLQRLENSAIKMSHLIDNLLQYARLGRVALCSSEVDVSAIANRIAADLRASNEGSVQVEPGIVVQGDPGMIEMVLVNLMENAWKYVPPGEKPSVEVGTEEGAIFVRDKGIGFDMQHEEKVWQPFERLHRETEYPGTGIGLANSKRIVNRHGGQMWAQSAPGKGTTMYFRLNSSEHEHAQGALSN